MLTSLIGGRIEAEHGNNEVDKLLGEIIDPMVSPENTKEKVFQLCSLLKETPSLLVHQVAAVVHAMDTLAQEEPNEPLNIGLQSLLDFMFEGFEGEPKLIQEVSTKEVESVLLVVTRTQFPQWVRHSAINLMHGLLSSPNHLTIAQSILEVPQSLEDLVAGLQDEHISQEMVLLLHQFALENEQIQQFIAFRDGFTVLNALLVANLDAWGEHSDEEEANIKEILVLVEVLVSLYVLNVLSTSLFQYLHLSIVLPTSLS